MFLKCASASNGNGWILFDFHVNRKRLLPKMQLAAQLPCIHHGGLGNREHPFLSGKGVSTEVYILKAFLRSTRTTGSEKRYNTNGISRESIRVHLLMLFNKRRKILLIFRNSRGRIFFNGMTKYRSLRALQNDASIAMIGIGTS